MDIAVVIVDAVIVVVLSVVFVVDILGLGDAVWGCS